MIDPEIAMQVSGALREKISNPGELLERLPPEDRERIRQEFAERPVKQIVKIRISRTRRK